MKTPAFLFLLLLGISRVSAQETNALINSKIDSIRREYNIPAIAVAIVRPDGCIYGIGGTTKIHGNDSVGLARKFHLGSNTKAVTSFIAMRLIERGLIQLDTKLGDLIPELSGMDESYKNVTLGNLLSHTAGIQPYTSGQEYDKLPALEGSVSEKRLAFAKFVLGEKAVEKGSYSNAGYVLAALMLEKAVGKTYEELVRELADTLQIGSYSGFPNSEDPRNPWGHWKEGDSLIALPPDHFYHLRDYMAPAGDLSMNIVDYSKFLQIHLRGLLGEDNILKSKSYTALHFGLAGYSYGWANANIGTGQAMSFHDGSAGTYYCHTVLIPGMRIGITVMMNSAEDDQVEGIYQLRDLLLSEYAKPMPVIDNEDHAGSFSVSPNPAHDGILVSRPDKTDEDYTIRIINNLGVLLYTGTMDKDQIHINTAEFPSGIYVLRCTSREKSFTRKLLVQH